MTQYKLTYFNFRGRAEPARFLFALAGVKYEDIRIEEKDWPALKASAPFEQIPFLEVDGTRMCQSNVFLSYLGEQFGLAGDTALERTQAAMVAWCTEDMLQPLFQAYEAAPDEAGKVAAAKKYSEEKLPGFLLRFEQLLKSNNGGDGYYVGNKLSYADIAVYYWIDWMSCLKVQTNIDNYPKLKALMTKVKSNPKIAEWEAKRPVTPM